MLLGNGILCVKTVLVIVFEGFPQTFACSIFSLPAVTVLFYIWEIYTELEIEAF